MKRFGFILLVAIGLTQAATLPKTECLSDADCSATECCFKKHDDLVVSKRGNTFEGYPINHQDLSHVKGVCQGYHNEGDACSPYDSRNGFCSCNTKAGQTCQYNQPDELLASKRFALPPGSGRYVCSSMTKAATAPTTTMATPAPSGCLSDAECSATECCFKKHEDLVVSKRGNTFEGYPINHQDLSHVRGVCQGYHNEGDACSPYDSRNGFCSCNTKAGQTCQYNHPDELLASKRIALLPGAGRYVCSSNATSLVVS